MIIELHELKTKLFMDIAARRSSPSSLEPVSHLFLKGNTI